MADSDRPDDARRPFQPAEQLVGVIMAGGSGTRFWPASTADKPKQFLSLFGENSLLQQSYDRLAAVLPPERILVLTSAEHAGITRLQLPQLPEENVVAEPMRRDTAAAVTLATCLAHARFDDPVVVTVTADHVIGPTRAFVDTMLSAARAAAVEPALYTFGIRPDHAATGFGYLELGQDLPAPEGDEVVHREVAQFVEKPNVVTAERYLQGGNHLWNSGMFVWRASTILEELHRHVPAHVAKIATAVELDGHPSFAQALERAFEPLEKVSIDVAVMERAHDVRCVEATFEWHDVGSFTALADHLPVDEDGNAVRGRVFGVDAHDNIVFAEDDDEVVALVGLNDVVVVRAGNRTLVAPRERAQDIKKLVARLDDDVK